MISMNAFNKEPQELKAEMLSAVTRVVGSGSFVLGKEVEAFEQLWADVCGVSCGVGVGNGMDAIEVALRALDIGPGDEVVTTPITAVATVLAIVRAGAIPILADIDPDTALLDPESVARCISIRTKAIILVHLYGQVRNLEFWVKFCESHKVYLIEDCAQAHLAKWQERSAGSFGKVGAYSFYPTKNLGALGDGGMLVTNDEVLAKRASRLRNYGQSFRYHHSEIGMNSRLDEIQAAILQVRLKWLPVFTQRRQAIAHRYMHEIDNFRIYQLAAPLEFAEHVYHLYVIKCDQRAALQMHCDELGIQTDCHYPIPVHQQMAFQEVRYDPHGLKFSERHAETCLSLPCHPHMSDQDVWAVIDAVNSFKGLC